MGTDQNQPNGDFTGHTLEEMIQRELEEAYAQSNMSFAASDMEFFGLALSGGGIRSATFNLGVLQGLHKLQLLNCFDYLSTVSGGGYIGSFWTLWRHNQRKPWVKIFPTKAIAPHSMSASSVADIDGSEPAEIQHLRQFSNFLTPRLGLLSADTGRLVIAVLSSMIPALLAALSLIILVLCGWLGLLRVVHSAALPGSLLALGGTTLVVLVLFEWWWQKQEQADVLVYGIAVVVATVVSLGVWAFWIYPKIGAANFYPAAQWLPTINSTNWFYLFAVCAPWFGCVLGNVLLWFVSSRVSGEQQNSVIQSAFNRATSRILFLIAAWTVLALLWLAGEWFWQMFSLAKVSSLAALTGISGSLFAWAQKVLSSQLNKPTPTESWFTSLRLLARQVLAYLTLACISVGLVLLVLAFQSEWIILGVPIPAILVVAIAITLATLLCFDPNRVGLHAFYRARLARAYLGAARHPPIQTTEELSNDDLQLSDVQSGRPFHLICCAANDLAPLDKLATLYRGADSAVLSPAGFSVGRFWRPWAEGKSAPSLGSAITASAAALNSHMGFYSMQFGPAVIFLMTALNLRLGVWLPNPKYTQPRGRFKLFIGLPFYKELLGYSRTTGADVLLSDGGHFENMALYELIRRRCRYIIASDCGMDLTVAFDDFGNVVRRVREDFGVEIAIDLSPLRPNEHGFASQHMVAGDIHYPDGDKGVLLFFKPSLTGDEPTDVVQYKRRNPAFPHESTGDQFYNEAQWESYRRLGEHAVEAAFQFVDLNIKQNPMINGFARIFAHARREWCPVPADYTGHLSRLNDGIAELDTLLHQSSCQTLLHEVYKEITELDGQSHADSSSGSAVSSGNSSAFVRTMHQLLGVLPATITRLNEHDSHAGTGNGNQDASAPHVDKDVVQRAIANLDAEEIMTSLQLIRRAITFMEEVYLSENLEIRYNHPLYLGVMNYFARWAYAPLFRMWWPVLKSMYIWRFTRFLEHHFGLASPRQGTDAYETVDVELVDRLVPGFAGICWSQLGKRDPKDYEKVISYMLGMFYCNKQPYRIQAAQLFLVDAGRTLFWDAENFFVPPGLWGAGIGEDFLNRLLQHQALLRGKSRIVVRIAMQRDGDTAEQKGSADLVQLYRSTKFTELPLVDEEKIERLGLPLGVWEECKPNHQYLWLVRTLGTA